MLLLQASRQNGSVHQQIMNFLDHPQRHPLLSFLTCPSDSDWLSAFCCFSCPSEHCSANIWGTFLSMFEAHLQMSVDVKLFFSSYCNWHVGLGYFEEEMSHKSDWNDPNSCFLSISPEGRRLEVCSNPGYLDLSQKVASAAWLLGAPAPM